jgi:hypothetical protein
MGRLGERIGHPLCLPLFTPPQHKLRDTHIACPHCLNRHCVDTLGETPAVASPGHPRYLPGAAVGRPRCLDRMEPGALLWDTHFLRPLFATRSRTLVYQGVRSDAGESERRAVIGRIGVSTSPHPKGRPLPAGPGSRERSRKGFTRGFLGPRQPSAASKALWTPR